MFTHGKVHYVKAFAIQISFVGFLFVAFSSQRIFAADWDNAQIEAAKNRVNTILQNAKAIRNNLGNLNDVENFVSLVNENRAILDGPILDFLQQGRQQIEAALTQQKQGSNRCVLIASINKNGLYAAKRTFK